MKIIKQWSLILLLAAFSFFSSSISAALDEQPIKPWVEPKSSSSNTYLCTSTNAFIGLPSRQVFDSCFDLIKQSITSMSPSSSGYYSPTNFRSVQVSVVNGVPLYDVLFDYCYSPTYCEGTSTKNKTAGRMTVPLKSDSKQCPPDGSPEYKVGPVSESPDNPTHDVCKMNFTPCPLGFYANAVAGSSGGPEQCVPISCPSKGTAVNNIKNLNNVIPNGESGTYCDGLCNYSIEAGGIGYQGQQFASGVSLGSQCGQSPVKGQKFTPLDKEKNCTEYNLTGADATFLDCQEGTIDEPVPDTDNPLPDVENAKVDENPVIDPFTGVECTTVDDKMSCVGKNITDALTKQTKDDAKLAAELHNKLVEQQKDITVYVEEQQRKREESRKTDAVTMVEAIQEVNRTLQTSGGSIGSGSGSSVDLTGIETTLTGIKESLEGSGEGGGSTGEPNPFYEPEYPNGFQDVWSKNESLLKSSAPFTFVEQFSNLPLQGQAPPMEFCFNLGNNMNYGCETLDLDSRIFAFIYGVIMITAAFSCRRIIFGG